MSGKQHRRILGETIRSSRLEAGLSQETLAEKAGLSAKFLGEVERGAANISVDVLTRIGNSLGKPVHELTAGF